MRPAGNEDCPGYEYLCRFRKRQTECGGFFSHTQHGNTLTGYRDRRTPLGFHGRGRSDYNEEKFRHFVTALQVSTIHVDKEVARKYAIIFSDLTNKGTRIPINNVWIAACCMSVGGTLPMRKRHFEQVNQIDKIILP